MPNIRATKVRSFIFLIYNENRLCPKDMVQGGAGVCWQGTGVNQRLAPGREWREDEQMVELRVDVLGKGGRRGGEQNKF